MKCFFFFFNLLKEPGLIKYPCPSPSLGAVEANLVVCGISTFFLLLVLLLVSRLLVPGTYAVQRLPLSCMS